MARILIVYGTAHGQTQRIAEEIGRVLRQASHEVSVVRGDALSRSLSLAPYDAFVVAASVLFGRHQGYIRRFVRAHVARLEAAPSAFVSVCGAMEGSAADGVQRAQRYVDKFLSATGWRPAVTTSFAGGLPYTRYSPWVRWMMKAISRHTGRPTDTSRDYDLTDWNEVRRFAGRFAALLMPATAAPPQSPAAHWRA